MVHDAESLFDCSLLNDDDEDRCHCSDNVWSRARDKTPNASNNFEHSSFGVMFVLMFIELAICIQLFAWRVRFACIFDEIATVNFAIRRRLFAELAVDDRK